MPSNRNDTPPLILMSNDDGIDSPGLHAAIQALSPIADIMVAAPAKQQSSTGRSLQAKTGEALRPVSFEWAAPNVTAYCVDATPALTVLHSIDALCHERLPDLMVSGINYGENLGTNLSISGTVGAAIEAATDSIPALAMSLETDHAMHHAHGEVDWSAAAHFTRVFAERMLSTRLPPDVDILNVVIPEEATCETAWRMTRQSRQGYFSTRIGTPHVEALIDDAEFGIFVDKATLDPGSDIWAVLYDRIVSVSPISIDMTSRTEIAALDAALRR